MSDLPIPSLNPRRAQDRRGWVLNPGGHRSLEMGVEMPREVDTPFGRAVVFAHPPPEDPWDWVCDLCSKPILTKWGDEPFPVPLYGSYAVCLEHFTEMQQGAATDKFTGDPLEASEFSQHVTEGGLYEAEGPWPLRMCRCQACFAVAMMWRPMIEPVLEHIREVMISGN